MPSLTYGIMFPQKVLLCQERWDSHPYWWGLWPHLPRGSLLSSRNHSPCALWSWDFCNRHSSLSVLALHSWLVLCGRSPAAVPSWLVLWSLVGYVWNGVLVYCLLDAALVYSSNNLEKVCETVCIYATVHVLNSSVLHCHMTSTHCLFNSVRGIRKNCYFVIKKIYNLIK